MNERKREEEKSIFSCADKNTKKIEKLASETIYVKEHNRKSRKKNQFLRRKKNKEKLHKSMKIFLH